MLKFWRRLFPKNLTAVLDKTKTVWIHDVRFIIRKINVLDYLAGNKVLLQTHDTYKTGLEPKQDPVNDKKIKQHYAEVLCAGVVNPRLTLKEDGPGIFVEKLFVDWEMVSQLYAEIIALSYSKKKTEIFASQKIKS